MVSLAKRCGGLSSLFPGGNLIESNNELSMAVTKAMIVLGYYEMPEDDQPDDSIWNHFERLTEHFEMVKKMRKNPGHEVIDKQEWDDADLMQNDLAEQWKKDNGFL